MLTAAELARAEAVAAAVPDPEIPVVTVGDLGILRRIREVGGVVVAELTPTYTGCPAVEVIEEAVLGALHGAGFRARVARVMAPAWTTDWITPEGREKLRTFGIAPPEPGRGRGRGRFAERSVACPRCGSADTVEISPFGSTPCKAQYRCRACAEPFDAFKCI